MGLIASIAFVAVAQEMEDEDDSSVSYDDDEAEDSEEEDDCDRAPSEIDPVVETNVPEGSDAATGFAKTTASKLNLKRRLWQ